MRQIRAAAALSDMRGAGAVSVDAIAASLFGGGLRCDYVVV